MRLRRRAPFTPTAVGTAAQLPLRAQALVPFALALSLVVAMSAGGAAFVARSAVDRELEAQAETARHLVSGRVRQTEEWLGREAAEMEGEAGNLRGRALEQRLMAFAVREGLTLAAARDATVTSDGRLAWARLPFAQALLERSRREGKPAVGTGRSRRGEPFVLAGAHGEGGRSWLAGRAIDRALLAEVERPTGVLVRLETLEAAAAPTPDGTRAFEWPLVFTDGSRSRLQVSVATDALRAATFSSLLLVGYAASH